MRVIVPFAAVVVVILGGCSSGVSPDERDRIAIAYAETLIARQSHPGDSLATAHAVDSVLAAFGYDNASDLTEDVNRVATEAEQFRTMLDSSQHYIELVRSGANAVQRSEQDTTKGADQAR